MIRILSLVVTGVLVTSVYASDSTSTVQKAEKDKVKALEQMNTTIPDSIKTRIDAYKAEISALKTEIEVQRASFKAKIDSQKAEFRAAVQAYIATLPDSLKNIDDDIELPDSVKAKLALIRDLKDQRHDSLKVLGDKRKLIAREQLMKELEKVDATKKAKFEKTITQLEKQLEERKAQAEKARKALEAKKVEIIEKIEKEKNK
jgi:hypothetical protein